MKCGACNGLGYKEYRFGLVMIGCKACKGEGEIYEGTGRTDSDGGGKAPRTARKRRQSKARKGA
uniref:Uncharacterized protein n=1 Tax=viral metagenome TaxID=1070528 RepID=A0A6M3M4V9_9ZZZZ